MNKKLIIILIIILVIVSLFLLIINKQNNHYLYIEIPNNSKLSLSEYDERDNSGPLYEFTKNGEYKINKRQYSYKLDPNNADYSPEYGNIDILNKHSTIKLEFSRYSEQKLNSIYQEEKQNIYNAVKAKYPEQSKVFKLKYGKLYNKGDWFAGKLVQETQEYSDKYQIVLHKENGEWKVVVTPDISLSKDVYPDIPGEVLEELNIINRDENMDKESSIAR